MISSNQLSETRKSNSSLDSIESFITPKLRQTLLDTPLSHEAQVWRRLQPLLERKDWKHGVSVLRFLAAALNAGVFSGHVPVPVPGGSSWRLVIEDILDTLAANLTSVDSEAATAILSFLEDIHYLLTGNALAAAIRIAFGLLPVAPVQPFLAHLASEVVDRMLEEPGQGDTRIEWLASVMARRAVNLAAVSLDPARVEVACVVCSRPTPGTAESFCSSVCSELDSQKRFTTTRSALNDFVSFIKTLTKAVNKTGPLNATKRLAFVLLDVLLRQSSSHASVANLVKSELCVALTQIENLDELTIGLFVYVVTLNRRLLVEELGLWLDHIFIVFLDQKPFDLKLDGAFSSSSSHSELSIPVINAFTSIFCSQEGLESLLAVFTAFDCSLNRGHVVEKCMLALVKIANSGCGAAVSGDARQSSLRSAAVDCLTSLMMAVKTVSSTKKATEVAAHSSRPTSVDAGQHIATDTSRPAASLQDARQRKQLLEEAVALFNERPNKGMTKLISLGFVGTSSKNSESEVAESVASFLFTDTRLSKKAVGEYLGENSPFTKAVLAAYVEKFNFEKESLVEALRGFLEKFKLPGEGQKIDRVLEVFASKYYRDNSSVFAAADVVYVLSFSLIMLNTDLHSEKVKKKMTIEEFVKNNQGIGGVSGDVPKEVLEYLFNQIKEKEIKLHQSGSASRRSQPLAHEEEVVTSTTSDLISSALPPFLSVIAFPLLSVFSLNPDTCLAALAAGAASCGHLGLGLERDAFINALAVFSLAEGSARPDLRLSATLLLFEVAANSGDVFEETAWHLVLRVMAQVAKLLDVRGRRDQVKPRQLMASLLWRLKALPGEMLALFDSLGVFAGPSIKTTHVPGRPASAGTSSPEASVMAPSEASALEAATSLVYERSMRLSSENVVVFVQCLCEAAKTALTAGSSQSSGFFVVKLVEVAAFNMDRLGVVWRRLWGAMADVFSAALTGGSSPAVGGDMVEVQLLAIDALKQLTLKFLATREEAALFHVQAELLRPLLGVWPSGGVDVQELAMSVASILIGTRQIRANLNSGWEVLLKLLSVGASSEYFVVYKSSLICITNFIYSEVTQEAERQSVLLPVFQKHKTIILSILLTLAKKQSKYIYPELPDAFRVLSDFCEAIAIHTDPSAFLQLSGCLNDVIIDGHNLSEARKAATGVLLDVAKQDAGSMGVSSVASIVTTLASQVPLSQDSAELIELAIQRLFKILLISDAATTAFTSTTISAIFTAAIKAACMAENIHLCNTVLNELTTFATKLASASVVDFLLAELLQYTSPPRQSSDACRSTAHKHLLSLVVERAKSSGDAIVSTQLLAALRDSYEACRRVKSAEEALAATALILVEKDETHLEIVVRAVVTRHLTEAVKGGVVERFSREAARWSSTHSIPAWYIDLICELILYDDLAVRQSVSSLIKRVLSLSRQ